MRRRAFTLIELLVVIGIVAALIALLFPTIIRPKETARRPVCLSNLRQLSAAWIAYANENRGYFCTSHASYTRQQEEQHYKTNPLWDDLNGWLSAQEDGLGFDFPNSRIWPYLRNYEVFQCLDQTPYPFRPGDPHTPYAFLNGVKWSSYQLNP